MPIVWVAAFFTLGVITAEYLPLPWWFWILCGGSAIIIGITQRVFRISWRNNAVSIWIFFFALGGLRLLSTQPEITPEQIAWYNDTPQVYIVDGVVTDFPDVRDTGVYLRVSVEKLASDIDELPQDVEGLLLAVVRQPGVWSYGDYIQFEGRLETPPEGESFSYRDYLARQGIYSTIHPKEVVILAQNQGNLFLSTIFRLRQQALDMIYVLWPDPEASLLAGILLGIESGIPLDVREAFIATGTSHIIAISGFNITIVAALFALAFTRILGLRRGALAALIGITLYTIFVGGDPAVFRAAILGGLALFAAQIGRRQAGLNSMALAALIMAALHPQVLWDVGFQLSFAATLGLVLYAEPLTQGFVRLASKYFPAGTVQAYSAPISEYILITLAAQITTLPVIIYHFQRLSLSSLIANPLILPAQPPIMVMGGLAVILSLIYLPLGKILAPLVWPFVVYTVRLVEAIAQLFGPGIYLGQVAFLVVLGFYVLLFSLTYLWSRFPEHPWREQVQNWVRTQGGVFQPIILVGLLLTTILVWRVAVDAPDGRLHLTMLDVGNGEAILIQSPPGRYVLINGGGSASRLSDGLGRRLPLFFRELDYLLVASPGDEQIGAVADVQPRFSPGSVLWAGPTHGNREARYLQEILVKQGVPQTQLEAGHALDLGEGASLETLAVGSRGAVLLLSQGDFRALLPIGIDFELMDMLKADPRLREISVLLLADSGYGPSNPPEWIAGFNPQVVLLSVDPGDYQGRPDPALLTALAGRTLLRTDRNGWIELSTDGERMWVEVEK